MSRHGPGDVELDADSLVGDFSERSRSSTRAEPTVDPVRKSLEKEVRERDATIIALEKKTLKLQTEYDSLEQQFEESKLSEMKEQLFFKIESDRLKNKNKVVNGRVRALEEDMKDASASVEYATLIKPPPKEKDGNNAKFVNYVFKLQKQVIEAVEKMQRTPQKMQDLVDSFDKDVNELRLQIMELVEERSRLEVQLRKQLELMKEDTLKMESDYRERIRASEEKLKHLNIRWEAEKTFEDLENELEEAEVRLEELHDAYADHEATLERLQAQNDGE